MYEYAETKGAYRHTLPQIRAGEYEKVAERIVTKEWEPDFGPASVFLGAGFTSRVPSSLGRHGLRRPEAPHRLQRQRAGRAAGRVLPQGTKQQAHRIALNVRTAGRGAKEPGRLAELKALGWYVEEYDIAQVSCNLTDYHVTNMHQVFEECEKDARALNLSLCGSELVGLVNLEAMLAVAEYYIAKENLFILDEKQKVMLAVQRLGLNSVAPFDPKKRIIEYMVQEQRAEPLASLSVRGFVEVLGSRTAAPGGGSASSLVSSMGIGCGAEGARRCSGRDGGVDDVRHPQVRAPRPADARADQESRRADARDDPHDRPGHQRLQRLHGGDETPEGDGGGEGGEGGSDGGGAEESDRCASQWDAHGGEGVGVYGEDGGDREHQVDE